MGVTTKRVIPNKLISDWIKQANVKLVGWPQPYWTLVDWKVVFVPGILPILPRGTGQTSKQNKARSLLMVWNNICDHGVCIVQTLCRIEEICNKIKRIHINDIVCCTSYPPGNKRLNMLYINMLHSNILFFGLMYLLLLLHPNSPSVGQ